MFCVFYNLVRLSLRSLGVLGIYVYDAALIMNIDRIKFSHANLKRFKSVCKTRKI